MKNLSKNKIANSRSGFTLIELLVVVLIIGILAAIAIPEYFKVIEKSRAAEAINTFDAVSGSEERYAAQTGAYWAGSLTAACVLDVCSNNNGTEYPTLKNFTPGNIALSGTGWTLTLTRGTASAPAPTGFGAYTLAYVAGGGQTPTLTVAGASDTNPCIDLGLGAATGEGNCLATTGSN